MTGVLLINLGTPDSPSVPDVRKYLRQFLMDARVIDIPFWRRFFLVNFIIVPFRAPKSAQAYRQLWGPQGSPLKVYGHQVQKLLQQALGDNFHLELAMRYQSPSIPQVLSQMKGQGLKNIIVIPLYPQYASASTGSSIEEVMKGIKKWEVIPELKFIDRFFDRPLYVKSFAEIARKYMSQGQYDHYLFSYHGLPQRQDFNYSTQCIETTRVLANELGIKEGDYTVCFQSRLGKDPWIKPYTDEVIKQLPSKGVKSVLAFSPSFIADCLETTVEMGCENKELFLEHGGERWQLVESLNVSRSWVECLKEMVLENHFHE